MPSATLGPSPALPPNTAALETGLVFTAAAAACDRLFPGRGFISFYNLALATSLLRFLATTC